MNKNIKITLIIAITAIIITVLYTTINGYYKNKIEKEKTNQIKMQQDYQDKINYKITDIRRQCHQIAVDDAINKYQFNYNTQEKVFMTDDFDMYYNNCLVRNNVD